MKGSQMAAATFGAARLISVYDQFEGEVYEVPRAEFDDDWDEDDEEADEEEEDDDWFDDENEEDDADEDADTDGETVE
jgi:hypothetical protein